MPRKKACKRTKQCARTSSASFAPVEAQEATATKVQSDFGNRLVPGEGSNDAQTPSVSLPSVPLDIAFDNISPVSACRHERLTASPDANDASQKYTISLDGNLKINTADSYGVSKECTIFLSGNLITNLADSDGASKTSTIFLHGILNMNTADPDYPSKEYMISLDSNLIINTADPTCKIAKVKVSPDSNDLTKETFPPLDLMATFTGNVQVANYDDLTEQELSTSSTTSTKRRLEEASISKGQQNPAKRIRHE